MYGRQAEHMSLFLFQNNFSKFDIEQMSILTKTSRTESLKTRNHRQLYNNISLYNREKCIIAACFKLQGHTFCAHTTMERNLSNNGDLKAG